MRKLLYFVAMGMLSGGIASADTGPDIVEESGIKGGLIVHLGCGDGKLTTALRTGDGCLVQGLDPDEANVAKARMYVREEGLYGPVSIDRLYGDRLPYADNLVRAMVVSDAGLISREEIMRVLSPLGVAVIDGKSVVKPWPKEMGSWHQHLGDSGNNAVAKDSLVGPPRRYQWIDNPVWSRAHYVLASVISMVSDKGRLYSIEDREHSDCPALPGKFFLVVRDAFSGVELWRRRLPDWYSSATGISHGPFHLQRKLVAVGDRVFCAAGFDAPITALDAETGEVLKTYAGTERTQEFVYAGGLLYAVMGDPPANDMFPSARGKGDNLPVKGLIPGADYGPPYRGISGDKCELAAFDADSGREAWRKGPEEMKGYVQVTLGICGGNTVYVQGDHVVCLDSATGRQRWSSPLSIPGQKGKKAGRHGGHRLTLVITEKAAYVADGSGLVAYSVKDGSRMWTGRSAPNFKRIPDLFVVGDVVWGQSGTGVDAMTGKQIKKIPTGLPPSGHGRCFRNRITSRWYITSSYSSLRNHFLGLQGQGEFPNPWSRSTCGLGHLPCNGLFYLAPHACSCANMAMLDSFNALATEPGLKTSNQDIPVAIEPRLEKGSAYGTIQYPASSIQHPAPWPTYRCNIQRGGCTKAAVSANLKPAWKSRLPSEPSAPVIADGKVFVSAVDAHMVFALDADDGKILWSFAAGARVDSPPTWYRGTVLFGSCDGWVYCLRAEDGELVWRLNALPDRLICAYQQVESAWPVCGSILVREDLAYFAAGRSTFLDGGIFLFAVEPGSGKVVESRQMYGPYGKNGFPVDIQNAVGGGRGIRGNRGDVMVGDGQGVYLRHDAFTPKLEPMGHAEGKQPRLMAYPGFLQSASHHRSFWMLGSLLGYDTAMTGSTAVGDLMLLEGSRFYGVSGYQPNRNDAFKSLNPFTEGGYRFSAGELTGGWRKVSQTPKSKLGVSVPEANTLWKAHFPVTGRALAKAGDVLFLAGTPFVFPEGDLSKAFDGRMGGVLLAVSAADGKKLAEYKLDAAPAWDSLAAAENKLFICTTDGHVRCFESE